MIFSIFTPLTNVIIHLRGFQLLNKSVLFLLAFNLCFEFFVIARHYKKVGALRDSIVKIVNDALILHQKISQNFKLDFNSKMCKVLIVKIVFADTPITCLRIYLLVKVQ